MSNDPYALWAIDKHSGAWGVFKTYKSLKALARGWDKHKHITSMQARASIDGVWEDITDRMSPREVKEFTTAEERDQKIIDTAGHFTIVRFLGSGQYERHKRDTKEEALQLADLLSQGNRANYMVYAVSPTGRSAFVKSIIFK